MYSKLKPHKLVEMNFGHLQKKKIETLSATITKVRELLEMNNSNLIKWAAPLS